MPAVAAEVASSAVTAKMPAVAIAASTSASSTSILQPAPLLAPAVLAAYAAYQHKDAITSGFKKIVGGRNALSRRSSVAFPTSSIDFPKLSISYGTHRQMHAYSPRENSFSHLCAESTPFFGHEDGMRGGIPKLRRLQKLAKPPRAHKRDIFKFKPPVSEEKPEWWLRTSACIPYLMTILTSDVGYSLEDLLTRYESSKALVYFVPGASTILPPWFALAYDSLACMVVQTNKQLPFFFRYHFLLAMSLRTSVQLVSVTSNFFPLIHTNGTLGLYYRAGVGLAYILVLLQCVGCALAGGYAHVPFISDAAYIHTMFNLGRPLT